MSASASERAAPVCLHWDKERVADWVKSVGFKDYRECFIANDVCGLKLVWVDASTLPRMGVTDWEHVQQLAALVRELLGVEKPSWNKTITLPARCPVGMFLEHKSFTGRAADKLAFPTKS